MKMKFIDTNVLAYAFYSNEYTERCQAAIKGGGVINTFNLVEAFFIIEKETSRENAIRAIRTLLKLDLKIVSPDVNIVFETLKRAGKNKMKIFDLIHYTTALLNNCSKILSYDSDFDNLDIPREEP